MLDATVRLPDGRLLGYVDNDKAGALPIIHFHGSPSSRLEGLTFGDWVQDLPIRLIAVDRPGFGTSDRRPDRTLLDWPDDVAALADALGIQQFAVSALSAGGPSAAAVAWKLRDRVLGAAVISGVGPVIDAAEDINDGNEARAARTAAALESPDQVYAGYEGLTEWVRGDPSGYIQMMLDSVSEDERPYFSGEADRVRLTESLQAALAQGGAGVGDDDILNNGRPWGFDPSEIACPYELWHGTADVVVPLGHARYLAGRIPKARLREVDGSGHFVAYEVRDAPFKALLESVPV